MLMAKQLAVSILVVALSLPVLLLAQEDGTALMAATRAGDITEVERLLSAGVDVNVQDEMSETALMYASSVGNAEIVSLLLAAGATVDFQTDFGETALMRASSMGNAEIVSLLLAASAAVNQTNDGNFTALMYAIISDDADTLSVLLDAGAALSTNRRFPALWLATDLDIFEILLAAGADPKRAGISPLMIAAFRGDVAAVRSLLHPDAEINPSPALHYAVLFWPTGWNHRLSPARRRRRHELVRRHIPVFPADVRQHGRPYRNRQTIARCRR